MVLLINVNIYKHNATVSFSIITKLLLLVLLKDAGPYLEHKVAGIRRVEIQDGGDSKDFSKHPWGYQVIVSSSRRCLMHLS